ncbi:hypothetical protein KAM622c_12640 [Klebsiella quasipneumoniae subsp. quasipneumoniae]|nr:hypothetical protein KAM622c_12640 [Klebsiella quasipneumoniae subsp. quasipneumoniae]
MQESKATGYPKQLPVRSYDFQAPIGEFGQINPQYGKLKIQHLKDIVIFPRMTAYNL